MTRSEDNTRRTIAERLLRYFRSEARTHEADSQSAIGNSQAPTPLRTLAHHEVTEAGMAMGRAPRQSAPVDLQLKWLIEALEKDRERYLGMRANVLAMASQPLTKGNRYDKPQIREAKARAAAGILGQVINGLDWLLSKHRPWNKTVRNQLTNNEQFQREDTGPEAT